MRCQVAKVRAPKYRHPNAETVHPARSRQLRRGRVTLAYDGAAKHHAACDPPVFATGAIKVRYRVLQKNLVEAMCDQSAIADAKLLSCVQRWVTSPDLQISGCAPLCRPRSLAPGARPSILLIPQSRSLSPKQCAPIELKGCDLWLRWSSHQPIRGLPAYRR